MIDRIDTGVYISVQYIICIYSTNISGVDWECACFLTVLSCSI